MRGLLVKEFYMVVKKCKIYFLASLFIIIFTYLDYTNSFLMFFPIILCSIIPVNLVEYDERSRWDKYCEIMPYTKAQMVSAKYITGLIIQAVVGIAILFASTLYSSITNSYLGVDIGYLVVEVIVITAFSSLCMPFIFKCGSEKGRVSCYILAGIMLIFSYYISKYNSRFEIPFGSLVFLGFLGIILYMLSWVLSIKFYSSRS